MNIYAGDEYYDALNGRYIKVESVDHANKTAVCIVDESTIDEPDGNEETKVINGDIYWSLFNFNEFKRFKQM